MILLLLLLSGPNESAALLHLATDLRVERTRLASIQSITCLIPRPSSCRSAATACDNCYKLCFCFLSRQPLNATFDHFMFRRQTESKTQNLVGTKNKESERA